MREVEASQHEHARAQELITREVFARLLQDGFVVLNEALDPHTVERAAADAARLKVAGYMEAGEECWTTLKQNN